MNTLKNTTQVLLFKDEVYQIVGAAMEVHRTLGSGFLEAVYQEALAMEFEAREIPFCPLQDLQIYYKGKPLKKFYQADFVVRNQIIVELKALSTLSGNEEAQVINYLKATGMELGVLVNFGCDNLQWKCLVRSIKR